MSNIYDIKIGSWDKTDKDMLSKYKGKVTLIINVTADCGNAPQYGIIESIYRKYKNDGFEVLAVPTNDYCGSGITYGDYCDGIKNAEEARDYAIDTYDVTYDFTEMIVSYPHEPLDQETLEKAYPGRTTSFPRTLEPGEEPHELYKTLCNVAKTEGLFGNFEKFLIDKNGNFNKFYTNGKLMEYAHKTNKSHVADADTEYEILCNDIEALLV